MAGEEKIGVLFVCLGNICRSPMAEGIFTHLIEQEGLRDKFLIDSAGTSSWHVGEPPDSRAREIARMRGFDIEHQRARKIEERDFENFQYILAMDKRNLAFLESALLPHHAPRVDLLLSYSGTGMLEVPDPYYEEVDGFGQCLDLISKGAEGLLEKICKDHL